MQSYTDRYYRAIQESAWRSARVIVPLVLELIQPKHVIDIGCGLGTWLSVFKEHGVEDIWGVDSQPVDRKMLQIPPDRFLSFDLTQPFHMDRQFDLVVSLEVAEHLPGECAEIFVSSLTGLGPIVLFSAAIPFQAGRHHVNEQWPEYWAELFQKKDYITIDCLRRRIWQNENVEWWYAQNILLFVARQHMEGQPLLKREFELVSTTPLSIVHPRKYLALIEWCRSHHDNA